MEYTAVHHWCTSPTVASESQSPWKNGGEKGGRKIISETRIIFRDGRGGRSPEMQNWSDDEMKGRHTDDFDLFREILVNPFFAD